jgi:hypothetical protein
MSSLSSALTRSFRTTTGMIRTRAASDRANPARAVALEAILRISSEIPEVLAGPGAIISTDQARQVARAQAQLVSARGTRYCSAEPAPPGRLPGNNGAR